MKLEVGRRGKAQLEESHQSLIRHSDEGRISCNVKMGMFSWKRQTVGRLLCFQ